MAARSGPPLDERVYHRPDIIGWWVNEMGGQPMDENMIHRYLTESPFFDYTTKNGLIFTQARTNHAADQLVRHRRDFEDQLSKQNGTEFMITGVPEKVENAPEGVKTGIFVIRKQDRKRNRMTDGNIDESLTTLGTYYTVGEQMFQARSVGDIVGNRLLSASTSLSKFLDEAASLPNFSPTAGYSYMPSQQQQAAKEGAGTDSAAVSPPRSRDGSVAPGGSDPNSARGGSVVPPEGSANSAANSTAAGANDARLLAQTMSKIDSFGDEFMDENPLVGEPGHFTFTSSTAAVKKRRAEEEAAVAAEKLKQQPKQPPAPPPPSAFTTSNNADAKAGKPSPSPPVMTEAKALKEREKERRGSRPGDKIKRKKSRANAQSPTTPVSAVSASAADAGV